MTVNAQNVVLWMELWFICYWTATKLKLSGLEKQSNKACIKAPKSFKLAIYFGLISAVMGYLYLCTTAKIRCFIIFWFSRGAAHHKRVNELLPRQH